MAFKMKKPSMIQGTQAHKKALANIQTQGYANRPDGRNRSSAFQKHEPGHKDESAWTDWEETGQEKEGFKYGDYERDPLTGQWKKVGTKTTTTPGSEKPPSGKPKMPKDEWAEWLKTPAGIEYTKKKEKEKKGTSKTEEDVIYKTRRLKTRMPELPGGPGKIERITPVEPEEDDTTQHVTSKIIGPKRFKKTKKKKVKFNRKKAEKKFKKGAGGILKKCGKGFQAVFSSTGEQIGCEPIPDSGLAKRGKVTERLAGKKEKYVAGKGEKIYGEDVKEGATVKIKTTRGRRKPPKVKVKIKKKGRNIESTIKPFSIDREKDVQVRGAKKGIMRSRMGGEEGTSKMIKVEGSDIYHGKDKKGRDRKVKYKKVIKVDPTRKKKSNLMTDFEGYKKYDEKLRLHEKKKRSWDKKQQKYLLGDPGDKPKRTHKRSTKQRVKEKIKSHEGIKTRKQVGRRHSGTKKR